MWLEEWSCEKVGGLAFDLHLQPLVFMWVDDLVIFLLFPEIIKAMLMLTLLVILWLCSESVLNSKTQGYHCVN